MTKKTKYDAQNFSANVQQDNKMLKKISQNMDDHKFKLLDTDSRLEQSIANSSYCQLWSVIICEAITILMLFLN